MPYSVQSTSTPVVSCLCNPCRNLLTEVKPRKDSNRATLFEHRQSEDLLDLLASAAKGCDLCKTFLKYLRKKRIGKSVLARTGTAAHESKQPDSTTLPVVPSESFGAETDLLLHWGDHSVRIRILNSQCDEIDKDAEHRPSEDLLSEPHADLISRWRKTCSEKHEMCQRFEVAQALPSRIIEIIDPSDKATGTRLVETEGTRKEEYACLSYCWGHDETGKATRANLSTYQNAIPQRDLPRIVIDAIRLCSRLGIRFLWVDRLCIIQDDIEDWKAEASKMGDIYSRSALTIAVPLCRQSSESFLEARKTPCLFRDAKKYTTLEYTGKELNRKGQLIFGLEAEINFEHHPFLEREWRDNSKNIQGKDHWLSRGWTFQEWMLSPRVLHIDTMTMWDCFEGYANELNRRHMEKAQFIRNPERFVKTPWCEIVHEYSDRKLSRSTDRLPALEGLAKRYGRHNNLTYVAGLWSEELPSSLFWHRRTSRSLSPISERTPNEDIPSWSWAHSNNSVFFPGGSLAIQSSDCENDSPIVKASKGWIDVKGEICVVVGQDLYSGGCRVKVRNEWLNSVPDNDCKYEETELAKSNIYLLTIEWRIQHLGEGRFDYGSLILQGCEKNQDPPRYKRLGMVARDLGTQLVSRFGPSSELKTVRLV